MPDVPNLNFPIPKASFNRSPKKKKKSKQKKQRTVQERLLRLFDGDGYEEFHTPKYVFIKQWSGDNGTWQVAIYTQDSYAKYSASRTSPTDHLKNIMKYE